MTLTEHETEGFIRDGFVHLRAAFAPGLAAACVEDLWEHLVESPHDPASWTSPVSRIPGASSPAIVEAINTDRICGAIDQLVGHGRWKKREGYGTFPVRFPSEQDPGDAGWHVDGSYEVGDAEPPWNFWVNHRSRGRALLILMLFTDVGTNDAPTRIRVRSHFDVAKKLIPFGSTGAPFAEVSARAEPAASRREVISATGNAGDVFLCHPLLMHAASFPHRGTSPRFVGQPAIEFEPPHDGYDVHVPVDELLPCAAAIRAAHDAGSE